MTKKTTLALDLAQLRFLEAGLIELREKMGNMREDRGSLDQVEGLLYRVRRARLRQQAIGGQ